jgi:rhodanese-related sulfurtransferase
MFAWLMGLKTISPAALHQRMQNGQLAVFDVNARGSWLQARVPGAKNLNPTDYKNTDLPTDLTADLVFYCSNPMCRKAPNAARRAKQMGYENVQVMSAGISGWLSSNLPAESGETP